MAQCSPVEIGEILDCRNGEEALALLRTTEVDVMFTDVRMPNMDGITLVQRMQALPHPPLTVIISGYDDFSYAVEALRCGAKEYLLKPVERDDISRILQQLEELLKKPQDVRPKQGGNEMDYQPLKYFLINPNATPDEREAANVLFGTLLEGEPYVVAASKERINTCQEERHLVCLENVDDTVNLYLARQSSWQLLPESCFTHGHWGVSCPETEFSKFPDACRQAVECWSRAFLTGAGLLCADKLPAAGSPALPQETVERIAQLTGAEKLNQALELLDEFFRRAESGAVSSLSFEESVARLLHEIEILYRDKLSDTAERMHPLYHPFSYPSVREYRAALWDFLEEAAKKILQQHSISRKNGKMEEAIAYIRKNYQKDLNMAMVSNHISVSYSFFSQAFKEYTGTNFIHYLKEIRISRAKELLVTTELHIAEIGLRVGFENEKHFMKVFRSMVGVSPTEYRRNTGGSKGKPAS